MAYDNIISRTDASALIPEDASREILQGIAATNPLLQLARRLPDMSRAQRRLPVMSALASAYFVDGDTGQKQTTEVTWENKYIDAEELAVIVPIPEAVLDDADYDIWAEIRPELVTALNVAINKAVLHGTNIPTTWTTNLGAAGLLAVATAASQTVDLSTQVAAGEDLYDILLGDGGVISLIEADGFMATGHLAHVSMRGKLRNVREAVYDGSSTAALGAPIFTRSMQEGSQYALDGSPCYFPTDGSIAAASALLFAAQWDQLVWAMRQDVTYKVLDQAVLQDSSGNIIYNLAQQDMVALRVVMRLGFALPNPINRMQETAASRCPIAVLVP
jgi:hypothetical protein